MVRDLFPVEDNAKVFSALMLVLEHFSTDCAYCWRLYDCSMGLAICIHRAGNNCAADHFRHLAWTAGEQQARSQLFSEAIASILGNYWQVIRNHQFFTYALSGAVAFSGLFAYISVSPSIFMELYQVSEKTYGWIFALLASGVIGGTQANRFMLKYFSSKQIVRTAMIIQSLVGIAMFLATWYGLIGLAGIIVFLFLFLTCVGFVLPNTSALCMQPFTRNAGSASAMMGALQMGIGSLGAFMVSLFDNSTPLPMTGMMSALAILALSILITSSRRKQAIAA